MYNEHTQKMAAEHLHHGDEEHDSDMRTRGLSGSTAIGWQQEAIAIPARCERLALRDLGHGRHLLAAPTELAKGSPKTLNTQTLDPKP